MKIPEYKLKWLERQLKQYNEQESQFFENYCFISAAMLDRYLKSRPDLAEEGLVMFLQQYASDTIRLANSNLNRIRFKGHILRNPAPKTLEISHIPTPFRLVLRKICSLKILRTRGVQKFDDFCEICTRSSVDFTSAKFAKSANFCRLGRVRFRLLLAMQAIFVWRSGAV